MAKSIIGNAIQHAKRGDLLPWINRSISWKIDGVRYPEEGARCRIRQEQLFSSLSSAYAPIISNEIKPRYGLINKTIWILWLQGENNAPALVKSCTRSMRKMFPEWKIVYLTEENLEDYVHFPAYINDLWREHCFGAAHYSDLIRADILASYGGLWADATVLCTAPNLLNSVSSLPLFCFKEMNLQRGIHQPIVASSWLIYARPGSQILSLTRNLLFEYWKDHRFLSEYFLFHIFFAIACERYSDEWESVPLFNNHSPHVLQFEFDHIYSSDRWKQILGFSDFHKLNHHINYEDCGNHPTFYDYVVSHY